MTISWDITTVLTIGLIWFVARDFIIPKPAIVVSRPSPTPFPETYAKPQSVAPGATPAAIRMTELLEMRQNCGCPGCQAWLKMFMGDGGHDLPHGEKPDTPEATNGERPGHYL